MKFPHEKEIWMLAKPDLVLLLLGATEEIKILREEIKRLKELLNHENRVD